MGNPFSAAAFKASAKTFIRSKFCRLRLRKTATDIKCIYLRKRPVPEGIDLTYSSSLPFEGF